MGRHTTPGAPAPHEQRDDVIGWGAFATVLGAVLVGLTAGWVHAVTVALLGGLVTGALWFVRNHPDAGAGRGRHASDTPWSASDLLDLKDDVDERPSSLPADRAPGAPPAGAGAAGTARRSGRRRAGPAEAAEAADPAVPAGGGPLEWVPAVRTSPEAGPTTSAAPWSGPDGPPDAASADGTPLPSRRRSGRRAAARAEEVGTGPGAEAAAPVTTPAAAVTSPAGVTSPAATTSPAALTVAPPAAAVPMSRRSRRAAEDTGGPSRPVLPVAPFGAAPAAGVPDDVPAAAADVPVAPPLPAEAGAPAVPADVAPLPDPLADPLAGPVDPGSLAAEPAVLDPALDGLWAAPVLELTVEQPLPPGLAGDPAAGPPGDPAADPTAYPAADQAAPPTDPAADAAAAAAPGPVTEPHDRERAAAELDPLWARRARRPQGPRRSHDRPAALRREPAPVVLQPVPGYAGTAAAQAAAPQEPVDGGEPLLVVLPEPDVPDVLMLPESDVVQDGAGDDAPAAPDDPAWPGVPGRQGSRPAPGTLSLDELLVLHTRRPGGRRAGSADRPGDEAGRRLE